LSSCVTPFITSDIECQLFASLNHKHENLDDIMYYVHHHMVQLLCQTSQKQLVLSSRVGLQVDINISNDKFTSQPK